MTIDLDFVQHEKIHKSIKMKKRGVVIISIGVHVVGLLIAGAINIVNEIVEESEDFEV